ncbi:diaminopimelate epimerase [Halogeometricum borinquense DSM 11551]|uniref:Diaminopimelate epimerase n=2 Tax=Halogeometricum borinquense TaxID=60847 RepID=E4NQH4_HALBP|nr:diaminopimelate epimerase [Halogeometricum borinquense]ADQ67847.1 diaminopimelate epimerase [Halogeometricum borinquense DSM 11551]ELY23471.1 diaminopimelate epimerase [Halogeometricum borinquense DSM 11551]RYJ14609.1 diaminopimelate epimerase [Halogeometricum borinquense]
MSVLHERVPVAKYHGTGNDFIVVDADESVPDRPAFASAHCNRESGIDGDGSERRGADGVLFLALEGRYSPPRVVMTLVQPDGSVAAMCGNGARCAAAWAAERTGSDELMIDTPAGTRHAVVEDDRVTIEMGAPSFRPRDVPLAREEELVEEEIEGLTVTALNTGVPHAIAFVDDVDAVALESVAPAVRHADVFPDGANVTVASQNDDGSFRQRTFERGVEGETQSCGTGAVAVVAAAKRVGLVDGDDPVTVSPPGGELEITVPDDGPATLTGPAEHEFETELDVTVRTP